MRLEIPFLADMERPTYLLDVDGETLEVGVVSMGNPHAVQVVPDVDAAPVQVQGPKSKDLMKDLLGESILDLKYYFWRKAEIKGVPVKITGTKALRPEKGGCSVEWTFDVTSGLPLVGSVIASFAGAELEKNLADEYKVLKTMA